MEAEISPKTAVPLGNTVFHADIRFQSASQDEALEVLQPKYQRPPSDNKPADDNNAVRERAAEMQSWWDDAISRNLNLPDGYEKVAVLIIKWEDHLDDLGTKAEANELDDLFRDVFNYETTTIELNILRKPQHQLSRCLADFVMKHDGPHNLMIVYYTGHGRYRERDRYLELCAMEDLPPERGFEIDARANWNKAEDFLATDDIEGDVLTILDTCYASNHVKSGKEDTRTFELLSACAIDKTTASPGDYSFTRALIDALKSLVKEYPNRSFTTFALNQRIVFDKRRRDTPSLLICRRRRDDRHISLAPIKHRKNLERRVSIPQAAQGHLTLRFALRDGQLNREQIEYFTKHLARALMHKSFVGLRRIDYVGMKPALSTPFRRVALAIFAITQWKRFVSKRRKERDMQSKLHESNGG